MVYFFTFRRIYHHRMNPFLIEATENKPTVVLDAKQSKFELSGRSFPPDSADFYEPIIDWLNQYILQANPHTSFDFKLEYFNSSSQKYFFKLLTTLQQLHQSGGNIEINWHYKSDDDDLKAIGEEFESFFVINRNFCNL